MIIYILYNSRLCSVATLPYAITYVVNSKSDIISFFGLCGIA